MVMGGKEQSSPRLWACAPGCWSWQHARCSQLSSRDMNAPQQGQSAHNNQGCRRRTLGDWVALRMYALAVPNLCLVSDNGSRPASSWTQLWPS